MTAYADEFRAARRDPALALLEGFHAFKHALRFGAELQRLVAVDDADLDSLAGRLAPDAAATLTAAERLPPAEFAQLVPRPPRTGVLALAARPSLDVAAVLASCTAPIVLLEAPRTMGNLGACIRVAAAAGAGAVLTTGTHDPWHPDALRGAAGLHFALPVLHLAGPAGAPANVAALASAAGLPMLAIDPEGQPLRPRALPARCILAFGTERDGLTPELLTVADARIGLPMRPGVSSLNLATSVSATLYAWRLAG